MTLTVAYSPCPNDTFTFYAWAHGEIPCVPKIETALADVQHLNEWVTENRYPISKISFNCLGKILDDYVLLPAGAALGRGCGPKIISKTTIPPEAIPTTKIAIPGRDTTAYLLLQCLYGKIKNPVFCTYEQVTPLIESRQVEAGLIIHETRFTYADAGFKEVVDLGEEWEKQQGLPIPLGGIVARRNLGSEMLSTITHSIQQSLEYAWKHPERCQDYILKHSQEKDSTVVQQHIDLYVTEESMSLSTEGIEAVDRLLTVAREMALLPENNKPWLFHENTTSICSSM